MRIKAESSPELLERLLRVCRHRGFQVRKLNAETSEKEKSLDVNLSVCSDRPINLLSKQIEKLIGITQVAIIEDEQVIKVSA
jgi:acetolactate synthase II small subunit